MENPFYLLAPEWFRLPMVILATLATVIASQAMISGAYSVARQCMQLGFLPRLTIRHTFPPTFNDPGVVAVVRQVAEEIVGPGRVYEPPPEMFGEDFSYMAQEAPGAFFRLGAQLGDEYRPHHNPQFDLDESALPVGAAVLTGAACRILEQNGSDAGA